MIRQLFVGPATLLALTMLAPLGTVSSVLAQAPAGPTSELRVREADEPVIRALLAAKPSTPSELVRATKILVDMGQPSLAQPFVKQPVDKKLDDEVLAALVDEFGSAVLLRLARVRELNPAAGQFCTAALDGAQRYARDPARLANLVKRLKGANAHERAVVVAALRPGGEASVEALVAALADPDRAPERAGLGAALVDLGSVSGAPLVAVLESADAQLAVEVIDVLAALEDPEVADYLLVPALAPDAPAEVAAAGRRALAIYFTRLPTPEQAAARLHEQVRTTLAKVRRPDRAAEDNSQASLTWRWDQAKKQLVAEPVAPLAAELLHAIRLAGDAKRLLPDSPTIHRQYLTTLAQAIAQVGNEPAAAARIAQAHDGLAHASIDELQDLLGFALADDQPAAGAVAAQLLAKTEDPNLLYSRNPQPSELVRALSHADRGLRFAALAAIMALDPREPFPGASHVAESLEYFARSSGTPRALVAAASGIEATRVAGLLAELGYEPDTATDGAGVMRLARTGGDYEVLFVDSALALAGSGQLIQRLRSDSRLARVPLAIISLAEEFPVVERMARRFPLCVAIMRTHNGPATRFELNRLLQATGRVVVDRAQRRAQGLKALEWIAALAGERRQPYDVRRLDASVVASLEAPGMTSAAIAALARLDTSPAQRALVNLASRLAAPLGDRQAAAHAFAESVAAHGTLLTSDEILSQYDRYNASETQSKETQQVLATILDTIEARAEADALELSSTAPVAN